MAEIKQIRRRGVPLKRAPLPQELLDEAAYLLEALTYCWDIQARPEQNPAETPDWVYWLFNAGRGSGKTRAGAERVIRWARSKYGLMHLVAPTAADLRDTMVEGPAGILACSPPWFYPLYEPSKRLITWPNGALALLFSAEEPERLRGPQCEGMWLDELAAWKYQQETWDMAMMGLRLGADPRCIITSTPKPNKIIKDLLKGVIPKVLVTYGTSYDNRENLSPIFFETVIRKYEGTRLGRQELQGQLLDDNPFALWKRKWIDESRVIECPQLDMIVVAIDPSVTSKSNNEDADDVGIVVAGVSYDTDPPEYYVIDDLTVEGCTPLRWAQEAITGYYKFDADEIIGEANNGGEMVTTTLSTVDPSVPTDLVWASRGKRTRAEPVSALYEQGRVHHVGTFAYLEDECCEWVPGKSKDGKAGQDSPNRLDALVWAITRLAKQDTSFQASII